MATTNSNLDDRELVVRALEGDQAAVGEIYDRYADAIYSFCRSRLRHDADAADATQDTFVRAATRLSQLRDHAKLRSWLYAIARNQVVATGRASARLAGDDAMDLIVAPDSEPDIDLLRVEASDQLWDAADGLTPRDHDVLELHLRQGLVGHTLADALGVTEGHANVLLSRVRDRVATSLGGLLVARSGRENCYELDLLLTSWDGRFTLDVRSRVTRHIRVCNVCEETRMRVLAGGVSFGVLPIIPAPSGLRDRIVGQMSDALGIDPSSAADSSAAHEVAGTIRFVDEPRIRPVDAAGGPWEWMANGFPATAPEKSRRGLVLMSAAASFVLLVVLGALTALAFQDSPTVETAAETEVAGVVEVATSGLPDVDPPVDELEPVIVLPPPTLESTTSSAAATSTTAGANSESLNGGPTTTAASNSESLTEETTTVAQTTTTAAPTTTAVVSTTSPSTTSLKPTTPSTTTSSTTTSSTTSTSSTTTSTSTTVAPVNSPPVFGRVAASPRVLEVDQGSCPGDATTVLAQVTDPDGAVASVIAVWDSGKGESTTTPLTSVVGATSDSYAGSLGTWFVTGSQSAEIIATDDDGSTRSTFITVRVTDCPAG